MKFVITCSNSHPEMNKFKILLPARKQKNTDYMLHLQKFYNNQKRKNQNRMAGNRPFLTLYLQNCPVLSLCNTDILFCITALPITIDF